MKKLLLNLFAILLLPHGVAAQATVVTPLPLTGPARWNQVFDLEEAAVSDAPSKAGPPFNLTELQAAHMDATRQEIFRWQDKMQAALEKFSAECAAAAKENHWPAVECSFTDLTVRAQTQPSAVSPQPSAKPLAPK